MHATAERAPRRTAEHVRLVYHYRDGHDFITETMLREQAAAYMPLLHAVPVDAEHYEAPFATIELITVSTKPRGEPIRGGGLW